MSPVGVKTTSLLVLLVLGPIILTVLALIGVLILWGYLCKKEARRKAEQTDGQEAVSGIALQPEHDTNNESAHPSLAECLRQNRLRCGLTQEVVAEALNVSRQAVSKWETGSAEPTAANLLALAQLYGISAEELLRAAAGE